MSHNCARWGAGATEWASAAVPCYQRWTARVDEAILGVYLSGGNTQRLKGALAPLLRDGPPGKNAVLRLVGRLAADFATWRQRDLSTEDIRYLFGEGWDPCVQIGKRRERVRRLSRFWRSWRLWRTRENMKHISLAQARDRLSALVNDAAHGGQRIVLSSRGRPKAALIGMEDLERLERTGTGAPTIEREMVRWIERVEDTLRGRPRVKRSSTEALREVREEERAARNGVPRRKPRTQAARRRGR